MIGKKVTRLVSSVMLLKSVSALGLQAQGGVTDTYTCYASGENFLEGLDSRKNIVIVGKKSDCGVFQKILTGVFFLVCAYSLCCYVGKMLLLKSVEASIAKVEEKKDNSQKTKSCYEAELYKFEKNKEEDISKVKSRYETKKARLEKNKEGCEKKVKKYKEIYDLLKKALDEYNHLTDIYEFFYRDSGTLKFEKNVEKIEKKIIDIELKILREKRSNFDVIKEACGNSNILTGIPYTKAENVYEEMRKLYKSKKKEIEEKLKNNRIKFSQESSFIWSGESVITLYLEDKDFSSSELSQSEVEDMLSQYNSYIEDLGLWSDLVKAMESLDCAKQEVRSAQKVKKGWGHISEEEYERKAQNFIKKIEKIENLSSIVLNESKDDELIKSIDILKIDSLKCVNDSLNKLPKLKGWKSIFSKSVSAKKDLDNLPNLKEWEYDLYYKKVFQRYVLSDFSEVISGYESKVVSAEEKMSEINKKINKIEEQEKEKLKNISKSFERAPKIQKVSSNIENETRKISDYNYNIERMKILKKKTENTKCLNLCALATCVLGWHNVFLKD